MDHQVGPVLSRTYLERLISEEETADIQYRRLAEDPVMMQNETARKTILEIADDEKHHAQQLKGILTMLEREGKIV